MYGKGYEIDGARRATSYEIDGARRATSYEIDGARRATGLAHRAGVAATAQGVAGGAQNQKRQIAFPIKPIT